MKIFLHGAFVRLRHTALLLLACLSTLTAWADDALTVTNITSDAATGVTITFSRDVKVKHSVFGTKCYKSFTDNDAVPSSLNATPRTNGNVVVLEAAYCTFVNGHHIYLALNPECFTTTDGLTTLSGETSFNFVMGDGAAKEPITALLVAPSNGEIGHLGCIAIVFEPTISQIVDPAGFTIVNDRGHHVPVGSVTIDDETSIKSLNVNVDPDFQALESNTTYSLHIAPGALKCGGIVNEKELVYGKWYVRPTPITLESNPPANRQLSTVGSVDVWATNGESLTLAPDFNPADITVTGIMEDNATVYASATAITYDATKQAFTITLDKRLTPASLVNTSAINSSVKLNIPEGTFLHDGTPCKGYQALWVLKRTIPVGIVTWSFDPASGSTLEALGTVVPIQNLEGETLDQYVLGFSIEGENAYLGIYDAANIRIVNEDTGATVMTFGRGAVVRQNVNNFALILSHQIVQDGRYTLIIPAASVNYFSDADQYSEPQHPTADIEATWNVKSGTTTGLEEIPLSSSDSSASSDSSSSSSSPDSSTIFDLQGRSIKGKIQPGLYIKNGRKVMY